MHVLHKSRYNSWCAIGTVAVAVCLSVFYSLCLPFDPGIVPTATSVLWEIKLIQHLSNSGKMR